MKKLMRDDGIPEDIWNKMSLEEKCRGKTVEEAKEIAFRERERGRKLGFRIASAFWSLVVIIGLGWFIFVKCINF